MSEALVATLAGRVQGPEGALELNGSGICVAECLIALLAREVQAKLHEAIANSRVRLESHWEEG